MATTTNYGWTTPDDTALVKDGASAIRTLGSSVDTTTKNLNPETTLGDLSFRSSTSNVNTRIPIGSSGQHLTVVAGVPAWATASDQTPLTTKGDLLGFSTLDARIPIGANATVLTADSTEALGLKWAAPASGGGMTLLSTTNLTGGSVTVSTIDQTYNNLYLLIENAYPAADTYLHMTANSDTTTANYQASLIGLRNSTMAFRPDNKALHAYGMDGGTARNNLIAVTLFNYTGSTYKSWSSYASIYGDDTSPFFINSFGNTIWYDPAAINSLTFTMTGSTMSGGTVKIYGVK